MTNPTRRWAGDPKDHKLAEQAGRQALAGWIRHPAVRSIIEASRADAIVAEANEDFRVALNTLGRPALGGMAVYLYTLGALGCNVISTSGQRHVPVSADGRVRRPPLGNDWATHLGAVAQRLADGGVPLDPEDNGNLLVIAQLLLLHADWQQPLLGQLVTLSPAGWSQDGRALVSSRHATEDVERSVNRLRRHALDLAGKGHIQAPYAGGKQRKTTKNSERWQRVLAEIQQQRPDLTASRILAYWGAATDPAVKRLRAAWDKAHPDAGPDSTKTIKAALYRHGGWRKHKN